MFELVNTSLPSGLLPGTHGFATVAMTRGLGDSLRRRLEDLSAYVHKTSAHDATYETANPVSWNHLVLPRGEHLFSRIAASPFDYTGRTNRLARLVCLPQGETGKYNAADVLLSEKDYFAAPWEGEARWLEPNATLAARFASSRPRVSLKPVHWTALFGEDNGCRYAAGFAALLRASLEKGGKNLAFVSSQDFDRDGTRALELIGDLIALMPQSLQPEVTFSTYPCAIPVGTKCAIRVYRRDDSGFAQTTAGVPVADFTAKVILNENLLPSDAELEAAAKNGRFQEKKASPPSMAVPASPVAEVSVPPSVADAIPVPSAQPQPSGPSLRPRLLRQSAPAVPVAIPARFDPNFGTQKKPENNLKFVLIGCAALLLAGIAGLVFLTRNQGSTSGGNAEVQKRLEEEQAARQAEEKRFAFEKAEQERREKEAAAEVEAQKRVEEEQRRQAAERAKEKRAAVTEKPEAVQGVTDAKPMFLPNVSEIAVVGNDDEAKSAFLKGVRKEKDLSGGTVWFYGADGKLGTVTFNGRHQDESNDGSWDDDATKAKGWSLYVKLPKPEETSLCRIWHFEKEGGKLYWIWKGDESEWSVKYPESCGKIDIDAHFFGSDPRVANTWRAANDVAYKVSVNDESGHVLTNLMLNADAADGVKIISSGFAAYQENWKNADAEVRELQEQEKKLRADKKKIEDVIAALEKELDPYRAETNKMFRAWKTAEKQVELAEKAVTDAESQHKSHPDREKARDALGKNKDTAEAEKRKYEKACRELNDAETDKKKAIREKREIELEPKKKKLEDVSAKIEELKARPKTKLTLEDAKNKWSIRIANPFAAKEDK